MYVSIGLIHRCDYNIGARFSYMCAYMYIFVTVVPCFFSDPLQHKGRTRSCDCQQVTGLSPGELLLSLLECT